MCPFWCYFGLRSRLSPVIEVEPCKEIVMDIKCTSDQLKKIMWDELRDLRAGTSTPQNARGVASLSNQLCTITRLEMDFARFVSAARSEEGKIGKIPMGELE